MAPSRSPRSLASSRPWVRVILALLGLGAASGVFSCIGLDWIASSQSLLGNDGAKRFSKPPKRANFLDSALSTPFSP